MENENVIPIHDEIIFSCEEKSNGEICKKMEKLVVGEVIPLTLPPSISVCHL